MVIPEAAEKVPYQILGAQSQLAATESRPTSVLAAPLSVFGSPQRPLFVKDLIPLVSANPIQNPLLASVPAPAPNKTNEDAGSIAVQDVVPTPAQALALDLVDAPFLALSQEPSQPGPSTDSPAPSNAFSGSGSLFTEAKEQENRNQVTIEDLGPDEEEDKAPPQDQTENDDNGEKAKKTPFKKCKVEEIKIKIHFICLSFTDLGGAPSNYISEENKVQPFSTISSPPPPQEYLPGKSF